MEEHTSWKPLFARCQGSTLVYLGLAICCTIVGGNLDKVKEYQAMDKHYVVHSLNNMLAANQRVSS